MESMPATHLKKINGAVQALLQKSIMAAFRW
jgi:hypothetical protein